jgi:hypothetical protein
MSATTELDSGVRVVVTPAQSSYFAGEPFTVTITFTNTRTPSSTPARHSHKRGAHSISSAPLARPPTSPGTPLTPRTAAPHVPPSFKNGAGKLARKGLIGKKEVTGSDVLPDLMDQRRKRLLGRSLSVTIAPQDLDSQLSLVDDTDSTSNSAVSTPLHVTKFHDGRCESPIK